MNTDPWHRKRREDAGAVCAQGAGGSHILRGKPLLQCLEIVSRIWRGSRARYGS